jgi:hypothetical protein
VGTRHSIRLKLWYLKCYTLKNLTPRLIFAMSTTGVTLATDLLASDPHFMCTISIRQLCTSIQNSRLERTGRLISLIRFEQLRGFRHQFIVLKIGMMPDNGEAIWLRLDRGPKPENSTPRTSLSRFTSCDSVSDVIVLVPDTNGSISKRPAEHAWAYFRRPSPQAKHNYYTDFVWK